MKKFLLPLLAALLPLAQARADGLVIRPNDPHFERSVHCMAQVSLAEQGRNEFGIKLAAFTIEFRAKSLATLGNLDPVCAAAWALHKGGYADYSATQSRRALMEMYSPTGQYRENLDWAKAIARRVLAHEDDAQLAWMRRELNDTCRYFENVNLKVETTQAPRVVRWVRDNTLSDVHNYQLTKNNVILVGCQRVPPV